MFYDDISDGGDDGSDAGGIAASVVVKITTIINARPYSQSIA